MSSKNGLRLAVDIGGTFTDTVLMASGGDIVATAKTPTTPKNPTVGALEGARCVLSEAGAEWSGVAGFIHGTTLATNALIERRGARVSCITTAGFRDILEIGYERRYSQYDVNLEKPDLIVPRDRCLTIGGRMNVAGEELAPLDEAALPELAENLRRKETEAIAICLLHAYRNPAHEERLRDALSAVLPDVPVSLSSRVSPEAREFDRLCTTVANAYVQPVMAEYLAEFEKRFVAAGLECPILMMTAGGGMTTLKTASELPIRLVESGPAGGAILAARIAGRAGEREVLSFDMGGTTAKLCLIDGYRPQSARQFEIARAARFTKGSGMPVRIPVLEMIEIGAGGGSIAGIDRLGRIQVGPQSAGSEPGPAAFGKGGSDATVTDADIVLGLIETGRFAEGRLSVDGDAAAEAVARCVGHPLDLGTEAAAAGISEIVDESMAAAGRIHAAESGKDLGSRTMIAFGGNGPLHATRVARLAGVRRILVPRDPGVGSAVGFLHAPVSYEIVRSRHALLDTLDIGGLNAFFDGMIAEARAVVQAGAPDAETTCARSAFMRYRGQGHEIEIALPDRTLNETDRGSLRQAFEVEYRRQFARAVPGMEIEILNWSVRVATRTGETGSISSAATEMQPDPLGNRPICCEVTGETVLAHVFDRAALRAGHYLEGPALIAEPQTTTYVSTDFSAWVDGDGNIVLERREERP